MSEQSHSEIVEADGHLIDSRLLTSVFDKVIERGATFDVLEFSIGRTNEEFSHLRLRVWCAVLTASAWCRHSRSATGWGSRS